MSLNTPHVPDVTLCLRGDMPRPPHATGSFREVVPHHGRSNHLLPESCTGPLKGATHRLHEGTNTGSLSSS